MALRRSVSAACRPTAMRAFSTGIVAPDSEQATGPRKEVSQSSNTHTHMHTHTHMRMHTHTPQHQSHACRTSLFSSPLFSSVAFRCLCLSVCVVSERVCVCARARAFFFLLFVRVSIFLSPPARFSWLVPAFLSKVWLTHSLTHTLSPIYILFYIDILYHPCQTHFFLPSSFFFLLSSFFLLPSSSPPRLWYLRSFYFHIHSITHHSTITLLFTHPP